MQKDYICVQYKCQIEVPDFIAFEQKIILAQKENNQQKVAEVKGAAAEIAQGFLQDQIDKALEYLRDPENQQALLNKAISLVKLAIKLVKK